MQFLGNFGKIVCWCPPGELAPPPGGNPGPATGNNSFVVIIHAMDPFSNEKHQGITLDTLNLRQYHQGHSQGQGCLTILINMHEPLI